MRLRIVHETDYSFDDGVFFEPHYLRFRPKATSFLTLDSFQLLLSPEPDGQSEHFDPENNLVRFCWFSEVGHRLSIRAESKVTLLDHNPFNFLLYPIPDFQLPFTYAPQEKVNLEPALITSPIQSGLAEMGREEFSRASAFPQYLLALTTRIHSDFSVEERELGFPHDPNDTFDTKVGSCRDLSWMLIQLLRSQGFASRFVSGYYFIPTVNNFELHAWVEVFLPGGGWIGFDPSNGIATDQKHITVACGSRYENTMPVTGSVRGDGSSELKTNLSISII